MDVDRYQSYRVHENNDHDQWVAFNRAMGSQMSAMEHLVPEEMFSTEEAPAHGISAVKAIQLAAMEGQRIWTITRGNLNEALAASQLPGKVQTDIRNSVLAGMEVTAHEKPVNFFGRESTGYIVLNPETGAGAYLIGSGENGSENVTTLDGILSWIGSVSESFVNTFGGQLSKALVSLKGSIERMISYINIINNCDPLTGAAAIMSISMMVAAFGTIFSLYMMILPLFFVLILGVIKIIAIDLLINAWSGACQNERRR